MLPLLKLVRQVLAILPDGARAFYVRFVTLSSLLAAFDFVSLTLIALVMTPTLTGSPITLPVFGEFPPSAAAWFILVAIVLIVVKGVLSVAIQWWATRRLARYELEVGDRLFRAYTQLTWEERSRRTTADLTRVADTGIANTIIGFLIPLASIPTNILTFLSVAVVLLVAQPWSAVAVMAYLIGVAAFMSLVVSRRVAKAGRDNRTYAYRAADVMTELVEALKEFTLRGRLDDVRVHVRSIRTHAVTARANISFLSVVPGFVIQSALMLGLLIVGVIGYVTGGMETAVAQVALFTVTGFRMLPAITGVQSSLTQAAANVVHARNVIEDIRDSANAMRESETEDARQLPDRPAELILRDVRFRYPGTDVDVLEDLDLTIPFGSTLGIAGPSGAGKSTLVDILLGLSTPAVGSVTVDGVAVRDARRAWRSRVAYVPQSVAVFAASIAQNVALTWGDDFDRDRVVRALQRAQLDDLLEAREGGVDAMLEARGTNLSGGQRQRLGIARALYSEPQVLVLDEATSALDGRTEEAVARAIRNLQGEVTIVAVAHRLATIRTFDTIAYLDSGRIVASGTFDELQELVPDFRVQARLAGLEATGA